MNFHLAKHSIFTFFLVFQIFVAAANDGYKLWLQYAQIETHTDAHYYREFLSKISLIGQSPTHEVIRKEFFKELFGYGHQANQRLWSAMMENKGKVPEKSIKWYNHILNAHQIWNNRIDQKNAAFGVWESHPIPQEKEINQQNYTHSLTILDTYDLESVVRYTNSKGTAFTNYVRDILFHIINHSTYHRGQIASDFRQNGLEPLVSDYIFLKRLT